MEQVNGKVVTDIGKSAVNEEMENCKCDNAFRYEINGKPYVYYHRLKDPSESEFDTYEVMTGCWKEEGNKVNADIWLFSSETELLQNDWHPAWRSCDYDDCKSHVGFPRDCGPRAAVIRNWNCLEGSNAGDCQHNTKFYVRTCGGVLPLAISTNLGWTLTWFVGLGGLAYVTVGMLMQNRRTGAKGMAALPHRTFWLQVHGLVKDGVQFTASRAGVTLTGGAYSRLPYVGPHQGPRSSDGVPPPLPPSRKDEGKSHRSKSKKEKAVKPSRRENKQKEEPGAKGAAAREASNSEGGAPEVAEARARQLAEQRDDTVHSSMAKVQVVTL